MPARPHPRHRLKAPDKLAFDAWFIKPSLQFRRIPAEILPKLATRAYTIGTPGGQGLGLYHAKNSVESWGGSLAIASTLGMGTTVTVKLPIFSPRPPGSP